MSDRVGNPKTQFSCIAAHLIHEGCLIQATIPSFIVEFVVNEMCTIYRPLGGLPRNSVAIMITDRLNMTLAVDSGC